MGHGANTGVPGDTVPGGQGRVGAGGNEGGDVATGADPARWNHYRHTQGGCREILEELICH